jgi:predicted flavoprotein YhiN
VRALGERLGLGYQLGDSIRSRTVVTRGNDVLLANRQGPVRVDAAVQTLALAVEAVHVHVHHEPCAAAVAAARRAASVGRHELKAAVGAAAIVAAGGVSIRRAEATSIQSGVAEASTLALLLLVVVILPFNGTASTAVAVTAAATAAIGRKVVEIAMRVTKSNHPGCIAFGTASPLPGE